MPAHHFNSLLVGDARVTRQAGDQSVGAKRSMAVAFGPTSPALPVAFFMNSDGGDEEDRTPDLRIANATLSQLSYTPTTNFESNTVPRRTAGGSG